MIRVVIRVWISTRITEIALIERDYNHYYPFDTGETGYFGKHMKMDFFTFYVMCKYVETRLKKSFGEKPVAPFSISSNPLV